MSYPLTYSLRFALYLQNKLVSKRIFTMCQNFLTISDLGILGTGRSQFWTHWVSNWDPRSSAILDAISSAGRVISMIDLARQAPRVKSKAIVTVPS